jgi:hypothetical protein
MNPKTAVNRALTGTVSLPGTNDFLRNPMELSGTVESTCQCAGSKDLQAYPREGVWQQARMMEAWINLAMYQE